jgi:hypothetical protein
MWLKLTEIKITGHTKIILLNSDCICHMMPAERNNADTYIKMRDRDSDNTFYFVKESIDTIALMLAGVPIMSNIPPTKIEFEQGYNPFSLANNIPGAKKL